MRWSTTEVQQLRIMPGHSQRVGGDGTRFVYVTAGSPTVRSSGTPATGIRLCGGAEHLSLQAGDFILLPRGGDHRVQAGPDRLATLVTGVLTLDAAAFERVTELMPTVLFSCGFRADDPAYGGLLGLVDAEIADVRPGSSAVFARLIDLIVSATLRSWLESGCGSADAWLAQLRDPHLARALEAIHSAPGSPWTVASLARIASASRSHFAERFRTIVGESPARYLTRVRMRRAEELLLAGWPVSQIAFSLGYVSDEGFRRAFHRHNGSAPTDWRRAMTRRSAGAVEPRTDPLETAVERASA